MKIKDELEKEFNEYGLPEYMHDGVINYVLHGIKPGDFLWAVICNDLRGAALYADEENSFLLVEWVKFFFNGVPNICCGTKEEATKWVNNKDFREGVIEEWRQR